MIGEGTSSRGARNRRRRVLALIFGSILLVLLAGGVVTVVVVERNLVDDVDADLDRSLAETAVLVEVLDEKSLDAFDPVRRQDAMMVFDAGGALVAFQPVGPPDSPLEAPEVNGREILSRVGDHFDVDGGPDGYRVGSVQLGETVLVLARPLDTVASTLSNLAKTLVLTMFGVLVALGLIIAWILRSGLRPVEEMIDTAQTIASGDYDRRVELDDGADDDIGRLGDALNAMLDQIQSSFTDKAATESRLKRFVSDASHELRTPLTTIRGYSEVYLSGAATDTESIDKQMTRINAEARRMSTLVEDLLTLARLDQGRALERRPVDLSALVTDAVEDVRVVDPRAAVTLRSSVAHTAVMGDEDRLRQVLANLLTNTQVHTPVGTPVTVSMDRAGDEVIVSIADAGPGMDEPTRRLVFDRFYRAEEARTRAGGGSGLGLAIARSIVESHHGTLELESEPGRGATFIVTLPCEPEAATFDEAAASDTVPDTTESKALAPGIRGR